MGTNRWLAGDGKRGSDYDRRFEELAAEGRDMHGEAALVASYGPMSVLDAGCGTGRVALELRRRGHDVAGVDLDPSMLEVARAKAPELTWVEADLADPDLLGGRRFDVVVLAGNVLIFLTPGTEGPVLANVSRLLVSGGRAIAGYSLRSRRIRCGRPRCPGPGERSRARGPLVHLGRRTVRTGQYLRRFGASQGRLNGPPRNGGQGLGDLTH